MTDMTLKLTAEPSDAAEIQRLGRPSEIVLRYPEPPAPEPIETEVEEPSTAGAVVACIAFIGLFVVACAAIASDDRRARERRRMEEESQRRRDEAERERQAKIDNLRVRAAELRAAAIAYAACDRLSQAAAARAQADSLDRDATRMVIRTYLTL